MAETTSAYTSFIPKASKSAQYRLAKLVTLAKAPVAFFLSCTVTRIPNVDRVGAGVGTDVGQDVGNALGADVVGADLREKVIIAQLEDSGACVVGCGLGLAVVGCGDGNDDGLGDGIGVGDLRVL